MSNLGKILLYVAVAGALAAAFGGAMIIHQRMTDATTLASVQAAKSQSDAAATKAKQEAVVATQAQTDAEGKVTAANTKIEDLNTQLTAAQQAAKDSSTAVQSANDATAAAQAKLDAVNKSLAGHTPEDLIATSTKAQSDLQAAQAEQQILQSQLQDATQKVADLMVDINNVKNGSKQMPGVSGKVTFVDHAWNFVILDVGLNSGVIPNGELIVYRGRNFLGKVRVTKVDPTDSVAEILPDIKGDIQIGDAVLN